MNETNSMTRYRPVILAVALFLTSFFIVSPVQASESKKAFNMMDMIIHHVSDAHAIHIIGDLYIPLPVILYDKTKGFDVFMSNQLYDIDHGHMVYKDYQAASGNTYNMHHGKINVVGEAHSDGHESGLIDFSITKSVFGMFLALLIVFLIFRAAAKGYKKRDGEAPTGIQNAVEPIILFLRDELIIPAVGEKHAKKFTPFLLSTFFFIWIANMLGLIPFIGGFNVTGTISITLVLATIVFIMTTVNGNKHYWGHILWPPGVPLGIKFIMVPIEIASIFIKPFVLFVRLTANITAGHIIILSFVGLILMVGTQSFGGGLAVAVPAVLFMIFMFFIELLVAFIQAFVFTLLTALYFGDATQEGHH